MSDLSRLNPTPHAIAVYASQPLSPRFATSGGLDAVYGMADNQAAAAIRAAEAAGIAVGGKQKQLVVVGGNCLKEGLTRSRPTRCRPPSRKSRPTSVSGQPMRSTRTSKARS